MSLAGSMQRFLYCVLAYTYAINTGSIYCLAGVFTSLISLNFSNSVARRFEQKRKLSVRKIPQHKMIIHQLRRTHASFAFSSVHLPVSNSLEVNSFVCDDFYFFCCLARAEIQALVFLRTVVLFFNEKDCKNSSN